MKEPFAVNTQTHAMGAHFSVHLYYDYDPEKKKV